jgi:S-methylmethionine-dependent homocysteine/selenocysteine methylase
VAREAAGNAPEVQIAAALGPFTTSEVGRAETANSTGTEPRERRFAREEIRQFWTERLLDIQDSGADVLLCETIGISFLK